MTKLYWADGSPEGMEYSYKEYRKLCLAVLEQVYLRPAHRQKFMHWLRRRWNTAPPEERWCILHESPLCEVGSYLGYTPKMIEANIASCSRWKKVYGLYLQNHPV